MDIIAWARQNGLLVISAVLALISVLIVPFDTVADYDYARILKTIGVLLCFLLIISGLRECAVLDRIAQSVVGRISTTTALCLVLVFMPFFIAMLFTNDVALVTVVPIAIAVLSKAGLRRLIPIVLVLQTAAAHIGGFLTPFGNPHNLYIYNLMDFYGFTLWEYLSVLIPIVVVGAVTLLVIISTIRRSPIDVDVGKPVEVKDRRIVAVIAVLFVIAVATVVGFLPLYVTVPVVVAAFLIMMPRVFAKTDYSILFIFFFLFVFANGMANIDAVEDFLVGCLSVDPMLTTVLMSQFTSNLPATVLLQPFTDNWQAVLVGADIGGFGTPIASMASIITLKFYLLEKDASVKRFFAVFIVINVVMLMVLSSAWYLFCT